ncbi:MAG: DUF2723 domain-containing protein [bacterium]
MTEKSLYRYTGLAVFIISLVVLLLTMQPTVSFWDCGEFIASSYGMQVPHPPGTPFFLMLGRLFSMIPFAENVGLRINMLSVLSSAFTILFLYLIAVKVIENFKGKKYESPLDAMFTYLAAAIGALSFCFSETFWFNSVEAEVYAASTFMIAFITWLMILWNERADEPDNEKYIIMIAYLMGLSTGIHLMSLLAMVPVVMTIFFRKYITNEDQLKKTAIYFALNALAGLVVAIFIWMSETGNTPPDSETYKAFDSRFVSIVGVVSLIFMAFLNKKIFHWNSFYIPVIIGAIALFAVYPGFVKYVPFLVYGVSGNSFTMNIIVVVIAVVLLGYLIYWSGKNDKKTLNLAFKCFAFAFIGYSTYAMIIIRSNQDTPINLNSPKNMEYLYKYVNREQYGDFPTFKRRFSQEPHQQEIYTKYSSDFDFFWSYQMNHMFNRYMLWNYVGRVSTDQDAGVDWSKLFGIPFIIGLFGAYYHFRRDWKMASIFLMMFIFLGWMTAFYQNQQEPQPRERDYFYVGAFFVFSLWISIGVQGVMDLIREQMKQKNSQKPIMALSVVILFAVIPLNMLRVNYHINDRSKNYVPWDYSYNMLQSVAPNAILFTNGDNDTFPLWYLQDVEGVRQDVTIANLSLLNTDWYIRQLKNTRPYNSLSVPMTLTDEQITDIGPQEWQPREVSVPVSKEVYQQFGITDTTFTNKSEMKWLMKNPTMFGDIPVARTQDIAVLSIILANDWKRPIYFAVTCSDDSKIGLDEHLKMEGLALRLVPDKATEGREFVDPVILQKQVFNEPKGFSKTYQPGFKLRGLDDPNIFFDDNHVRMFQNYRNSFLRLALYYIETEKNDKKAIEVLDKMDEKIPHKYIPIDWRLLYDISNFYYTAGALDRFVEYATEVEKEALKRIDENPNEMSGNYSPYNILIQIYESLGEYDKAVDILLRLQKLVPNNQQIKQMIEQYRRMAATDTSEVVPKVLENK